MVWPFLIRSEAIPPLRYPRVFALLFALESAAAGFPAMTGIGSGDIYGTGFTVFLVVERTFAGHAAYLYIGISAAGLHGIALARSLLEAGAAGFIYGSRMLSVHLNSISGAELLLVVHAFCG